VLNEVTERLGPTLNWAGWPWLISLAGLPLGIVSAARRQSLLDHVLTFLSFAASRCRCSGSPSCSASVQHRPGGCLRRHQTIGGGSVGDRLAHIPMPAAVLSLATVASWSRYIRSGMIDG